MNQVIIGLSGHIDHGKTSLVKSLTGMNTDKMKEEIQRGMTIDIGFAFLNDNITIIDVPGHEKFLKNMMTGVSTIDMALLVIAADDGVMPQTREHLDILNLLGINNGCIVINKIDLVDSEWLELIKSDVSELIKGTFFENAPIIDVSAINNLNIDKLKNELINISQCLPQKKNSGVFRMHIDRVFTKKGFGTVVTGTVLSGKLSIGEEVEIMPELFKAKVRNIQSHDKLVDKVIFGDRAAINLQGIDKKKISRGSQIVKKNYFIRTNQIAALIDLLPNEQNKLKHNQRVRLHIGTQEVIARIFFINNDKVSSNKKYIVLLKLESFVTVTMDDKFIIRSYSPMIIIGGGIVIDNELKGRWKKVKEYLKDIYSVDDGIQIDKIIENYFSNPMTLNQAKFKFGISVELLLEKIKNDKNIYIIKYKNDNWLITINQMEMIKNDILKYLEIYHKNNPYLKGSTKEEIRQLLKTNDNFIEYILKKLLDSNYILKDENFLFLKSHIIEVSNEIKRKIDLLMIFLDKEKFSLINSKDLMTYLQIDNKTLKSIIDISINTKKIIKVDSNIIVDGKHYIQIKKGIIEHFKKFDFMSVNDFKNLAKTSRKYAVPLLEFFDKNKITYRDGNNRKMVK